MSSISDRSAADARLRAELWSWSAWLVLCIISYPAMMVLAVSPWAGLVGFAIAAPFLILIAGAGYTGRRTLARWQLPAAAAFAAAALVSATAYGVDGRTAVTAGLCSLTVAMEIIFTWHFLPWIVHDAVAAESLPPSTRQRRAPGRRRPGEVRSALGRRRPGEVRSALGFALLLGLLVLAFGAAWARGERAIPAPTGWLIALFLLTFGLMFVERMSFFQRSARYGNLVICRHSYARWLAAGLLVFAISAGVAAVAPTRARPEQQAERPAGAASRQATSAEALEESIQRAVTAAGSAVAQAGGAARAMPRPLLSLWLLLLLLLIALFLVWALPRSRVSHWLSWLTVWLWTTFVRWWSALASLIARWLAPRSPAPDDAGEREQADPLGDIFEDPETLAGLSPRELVIRTYHLLLNFAEMLGHGRPVGQTPFEYARGLAQVAPAERDTVRWLTWAYAGAMYGEESAAMPPTSEVQQAWRRIADALQHGLTPEELEFRRRAYLAARALEKQSGG